MDESGTVTLRLPWPPSANHYWRHVGRKVLISKKGRLYRSLVAMAVHQAGRPRIDGRLAVVITAHAGDVRARDLDNLQKATLDALQGSRVFANDSLIDDLRTIRGEITIDDPHLVVRVSQLERDVMAEAKRRRRRARGSKA